MGNGVSRWRNRNDHIGVSRGGMKVGLPGHREDPAVAARRAGDRSRNTEPMLTDRRLLAYVRTNRAVRLTPRQSRRIEKKAARNLKWAHLHAAGTP